MKKLTFVALFAIAAISMISCGGSSKKTVLNNDVDSLSYALGVSQGMQMKDGLYPFLEQNGLDSTYAEEFFKGMQDGAISRDDKKKLAYYMGISQGMQLSLGMVPNVEREFLNGDSTRHVSATNLINGMIEAIKGEKSEAQSLQADSLINVWQERARAEQEKKMEEMMLEQYGDVKKQNDAFLAENAKKEGVKNLVDGIQYKVLTEGTGAVPADTSVVSVFYEGRLIDGTVFDGNYGKEPLTLNMSRPGVITGWVKVLKKMPAGAEWEVYLPYKEAYGVRGHGEIPPFATLIFKMKLAEVK